MGFLRCKKRPHLIGELLNQTIGIKMKHVPFEGDAKALMAVLGGHVDLGITMPTSIIPHLKAGTVTVLATPHSTRMEGLPDVPTLKELGYPEATFTGTEGFFASFKVPADRLAILQAAFEKAIKDPEVEEGLRKGGMIPAFLSGKEYDAAMASSAQVIKELVTKAGIKD